MLDVTSFRDNSDVLTRLAFTVYGNPGVYALLLGSGLSRAAGIPTGHGITVDLIRQIAIAQGETNQLDWVAWYYGKFGKPPDYSELIAELGPTSHERRVILANYIEPTEEDIQYGRKIPTSAHRAIADLVRIGMVRVLITTNFDRLQEQALRERGIEPTVVDSEHALRGAEPLTHANCYLLKLHGDYKDARILNTELELSRYNPEITKLLNRILDDYGLIVCGWSGSHDIALRDCIVGNPSRRYSLYWTTRGSLSDNARRIVNHRRGHIVDIADADDFFGNLCNQIQTLARTHQQDPLNIDLLVNSAKRLAAEPDLRIDLHDLVEAEVQKCLDTLRNSTPEVDTTSEGVERLIAFQMSSIESLARVFGVLGRWGDGTEFDSVVSGLVAIWLQVEESTSTLAYLRCYPAVLLLWAYGIGLTIARRWRDLHCLLSHPVQTIHGSPHRFVYLVAEWLLEGYRNEIWRRLPKLQEHRTPDSEHRYAALEGWRNSFAAIMPDFEDVYDRWEILFALIYCEYTPGETDRQSSYFWAPTGRHIWRIKSRQQILASIADGDLHQHLVAAGLAGGNGEQLAVTVSKYGEFVDGVR